MMNERLDWTSCTIVSVAIFMGLLSVGCRSESSEFDKLRKQQQLQESSRVNSELDVEEQIELAKQELKLGSLKRAKDIVEPLLISHPDHVVVMRLMAEIQYRSGATLTAAELLATIPYEDEDRSIMATLKAVDWYLKANAYEPAIELLRNKLDASPTADRVRHRLTEVLNQTGQRIAASRVLKPLVREGNVSERELFSLVTLGEAFIDETLSAPDFSSPTLANLSLARRRQGEEDLVEAKAIVSELRSLFPESTAVAAFQGRVFADLQDFPALERWYQDLPSEIANEPEYWYALGQLAFHRDDYPAAIRCFGEALQLDPTDRHSLVAMARAFRRIDANEEADKAMRQFELLQRTSELAKVFGLASGTPAEYREMANLLDKLGRPWESIAWERIAIAKTGNQQRDEAALLQREKILLQQTATVPSLADSNLPWSREELSQWPLPNLGTDSQSSSQPLPNRPSSLSSVPGSIRFRDITSDVKLRFRYDNGDDQSDDEFYLHQQTGGGIGVLDFDRDGWVDLYCAQAGKDALDGQSNKSNQLFRNLSPAPVSDVTADSMSADRGYGQGITVADINQDGFPDLLVANIGKNILFTNNADGTFASADLRSVDNNDWTTSIACGDLNGDHLPELIEVNYIEDPAAFETPCLPANDACGPSRFKPAADRWWSLDPTGTFQTLHSPATKSVSSVKKAADAGHGFAVIIGNLNNQLGNDVYIANDGDANFFWQNRQSTVEHGDDSGPATKSLSAKEAAPLRRGRKTSEVDSPPKNQPPFRMGSDSSHEQPSNGAWWNAEETAYLSGIATSQQGGRHGSMGLTFGDFDRNGLPDLHVTNYWDQEADLYLQGEGAVFRHSSRSWKIRDSSKPTVGWGTQAADFDRDGRSDLMVLNGHIVNHTHRGIAFRMLPQLYQGHDDHFALVSDSPDTISLPNQSFWSEPTLGRALAVLDWNRDGMPDVVATHLDQPTKLLQNESEQRSWLQLELVGTTSERDAVGATVQIQCESKRWTNWVTNGGFLASNEAAIDFGLGDLSTSCKVTIQWPSGHEQKIDSLPLNERYLVVEGKSAEPWIRENHSRR